MGALTGNAVPARRGVAGGAVAVLWDRGSLLTFGGRGQKQAHGQKEQDKGCVARQGGHLRLSGNDELIALRFGGGQQVPVAGEEKGQGAARDFIPGQRHGLGFFQHLMPSVAVVVWTPHA